LTRNVIFVEFLLVFDSLDTEKGNTRMMVRMR
jgi:hypothetical protein